MIRQNLFSDEWDGDDQEARTRHRVFWRPDDARMGATLYELAPGAPEHGLHMHYGVEEMFFVLSGRPMFRNLDGREQLAQETSSARRDGPGCTHSAIRPTNPFGCLR
jgi:Cupin domain